MILEILAVMDYDVVVSAEQWVVIKNYLANIVVTFKFDPAGKDLFFADNVSNLERQYHLSLAYNNIEPKIHSDLNEKLSTVLVKESDIDTSPDAGTRMFDDPNRNIQDFNGLVTITKNLLLSESEIRNFERIIISGLSDDSDIC